MLTARHAEEALDRLLEPFGEYLDPDSARRILDFRLDPKMLDRIDELASQSDEGTLDEAGRLEYEGYVQGVGLLNVLRAKASLVLVPGLP